MTPTEPTRPMLRLAAHARMRAMMSGFYTGGASPALIDRCRHTFEHPDTIAVVLFTRDIGHHTQGWWKNPDYERCEHLSLSFYDRASGEHARQDQARAKLWCQAFFREWCRLLWVEPPFSEHGKAADVYHYRLFMLDDWKTPLLPRGEVYTRKFTEAGWKSFSELHGEGIGQ